MGYLEHDYTLNAVYRDADPGYYEKLGEHWVNNSQALTGGFSWSCTPGQLETAIAEGKLKVYWFYREPWNYAIDERTVIPDKWMWFKTEQPQLNHLPHQRMIETKGLLREFGR